LKIFLATSHRPPVTDIVAETETPTTVHHQGAPGVLEDAAVAVTTTAAMIVTTKALPPLVLPATLPVAQENDAIDAATTTLTLRHHAVTTSGKSLE